MLETLQRLCSLLGKSPLTVQDLASDLGVILEDQGENLPLIVRPSDSSFAEAHVLRRFETQQVAHVKLTVADPNKLSVKALHDTFGEYMEVPRRHLRMPRRIRFFVGVPTQPGSCSIIAEVKAGQQGIEDGTVVAVTVQPEFG